jgi:hypothetical protein
MNDLVASERRPWRALNYWNALDEPSTIIVSGDEVVFGSVAVGLLNERKARYAT